MAPRKSVDERKNEPTANVTTRRSKRVAAVGTDSHRIVRAAAKREAAKTQSRNQAKTPRSGKNVADQARDQEILSVSRVRPPQTKQNTSIDSAKDASHAPKNPRISTGETPRPTTEARSGAMSVVRAANDAGRDPRDDGGDNSQPAASDRRRIVDYDDPVPDENLDAADRARPEDRASASPVEHGSKTGGSRGKKRRSQDARNDDPPPLTGKRTRKSNELPFPREGTGAPSNPPSEDPGHNTPPPEPSLGQRFNDLLLRAVVTDRALRERREQYEACCRLLKDDEDRIAANPRLNPRAWIAGRDTSRTRALRSDQDTADCKVKYMDRQLKFCVDELRNFPHVSREDDGLEFFADCDDFWRCFGRFREMLQEKKQDLTDLDNMTKQLYGRIFEYGDHAPIPAIVEANAFEDLDDLPDVMARLETSEERVTEFEEALKTLAQNVLWSAEFVFVRSGVLVHENILYNWDDSEQVGLDGQEDWPVRENWREPVLPEYESGDDDLYQSQWRYMATQAFHGADRLRNARAEQWDRYAPDRKVDGVYITERYGRVRNGRVEKDGSSERAEDYDGHDPERYRYAPTSLTPGKWAPGSYATGGHQRGHARNGDYIDRYGRRWVMDSPPAERSMRKRFDLARSDLRRARGEFEDARFLTQSDTRHLPRPVTEDAKGLAAAQKLIRRTRALTDAIRAYKETYEQARKAGLTEGGEKTAYFTDRESDGHAEPVWDQIIVSGKARVPLDWDGLHLIPQEAPLTPKELDRSLRRLLSPRLGEDSSHVAEPGSRYRNRIDALLTEGYNLREQGLFPDAEADELIFE